jgi:hypothetical protein
VNEMQLLAWRAYPVIWLCLALAAVRASRRIASDHPLALLARMMIGLGLALNTCVTQLNGATMPVIGMLQRFRPATPLWTEVNAGHRMLFLADNVSLYYFSIGDLMLIGGGIVLLTCWISSKRHYRSPGSTL